MDGWTMASYPTSYCCVLATLATCITIPLPREYRTDTAFPTVTAEVTLVHSPSASSQTVHNGTSPTINTLNILCMITIHNWLIHIRCKSHQTEFHRFYFSRCFHWSILITCWSLLDTTALHHSQTAMKHNEVHWVTLTFDLAFRWAKPLAERYGLDLDQSST